MEDQKSEFLEGGIKIFELDAPVVATCRTLAVGESVLWLRTDRMADSRRLERLSAFYGP